MEKVSAFAVGLDRQTDFQNAPFAKTLGVLAAVATKPLPKASVLETQLPDLPVRYAAFLFSISGIDVVVVAPLSVMEIRACDKQQQTHFWREMRPRYRRQPHNWTCCATVLSHSPVLFPAEYNNNDLCVLITLSCGNCLTGKLPPLPHK